MGWVGAFNYGACTVIVRDQAYNALFSAPIGLGDSANFTDPTFGLELTISVDSSGNVTLTAPADFQPSQSYSVIVAPNYNVAGAQMQNGALSVSAGTQQGACFAEDSSDADVVPFSGLHPVIPQPILLTSIPGNHTVFGMRSGTFAPPLTIIGSLPSGRVGVSYSAALGAQGGVTPYTPWSVISGELPDGLAIDPITGLIYGLPTTSGTFSFTVQVKDAISDTATKPTSINIVANDRAARFHGAPDALTTPFASPILGSSNFTVECMAMVDASDAINGLVSGRATNTKGWALQIQDGSFHWRQAINGDLIDNEANALDGGLAVNNTLYHIAVTRQVNLFTLWINGVNTVQKTIVGTIDEPDVTVLALGTSFFLTAEGENPLRMKWFALTLGTARYTSNFTPPISASAITGSTSAIDFDGPLGSTTFTDYTGRIWTNNGAVDIELLP